MSQENLDVIRGLYDSFSRGDVPAALGQMDAAVEGAKQRITFMQIAIHI